MRSTLLLLLATILSGSRADAQSGAGSPNLTFIPGSSVKLYQVSGDCDWSEWDATITTKSPTCKPTTSQTATKADVLGNDVASSFEHNGELIMMFGDTIGADIYYPRWVSFQNAFPWHAHDPIARSTTQHARDGLLLTFFTNGNHGLEVLPPPQPDGTAVDMTVDNIPEGGISLDGQIYIVAKTGSVDSGGNIDNSHAYSVLVKFDESRQGFSSARTMSKLPGGHFVHLAMYEASPGLLGNRKRLMEWNTSGTDWDELRRSVGYIRSSPGRGPGAEQSRAQAGHCAVPRWNLLFTFHDRIHRGRFRDGEPGNRLSELSW